MSEDDKAKSESTDRQEVTEEPLEQQKEDGKEASTRAKETGTRNVSNATIVCLAVLLAVMTIAAGILRIASVDYYNSVQEKYDQQEAIYEEINMLCVKNAFSDEDYNTEAAEEILSKIHEIDKISKEIDSMEKPWYVF